MCALLLSQPNATPAAAFVPHALDRGVVHALCIQHGNAAFGRAQDAVISPLDAVGNFTAIPNEVRIDLFFVQKFDEVWIVDLHETISMVTFM